HGTIGPGIIDFFSVIPPEHRTCNAISNLRRLRGRRGVRQIQRPDKCRDSSSSLIRDDVGNKAAIRGEEYRSHLRIAFIELDGFVFSLAIEWQNVQDSSR